jgi:hypothetical protein
LASRGPRRPSILSRAVRGPCGQSIWARLQRDAAATAQGLGPNPARGDPCRRVSNLTFFHMSHTLYLRYRTRGGRAMRDGCSRSWDDRTKRFWNRSRRCVEDGRQNTKTSAIRQPSDAHFFPTFFCPVSGAKTALAVVAFRPGRPGPACVQRHTRPGPVPRPSGALLPAHRLGAMVMRKP